MMNNMARNVLIDQFEQLFTTILTNLQEKLEEQNKNQQKILQEYCEEKSILHSGDYYGAQIQYQDQLQSTIDFLSYCLSKLNKFKEQFNEIKDIILMLPLDKKECDKYLQNNKEFHKSSIIISYVQSVRDYNNSEIKKQSDVQIKQKLFNFIESLKNSQTLKCPKHQQQVKFINIQNDLNNQERRICTKCNQDVIKIQLKEFLEQYLMQFIEFKIHQDETRSVINKQIQELSNLILTQKYTNTFYNELDMIFKERISIIDSITGSQLNNNDYLNNMAQDYIQTQHLLLKQKQTFDKQVKDKVKEDLQSAKELITKILNNDKLQNQKIQKQLEQIEKKYSFKYTYLYKMYQSEKCQALSFNNDDSIIATAKQNTILFWSFEEKSMSLIAEFQGHKQEINCLLFVENSNLLISTGGNSDPQTFVWEKQENSEWKQINIIENKQSINAMVFVSKSNELIFGCQDGTIEIYQVNPVPPIIKLIKKLLSVSKQGILGLSLNNSNTKMVSCGMDMQLRMFELGDKFQLVRQKNCDSPGQRIQFIDDDTFVTVQKNGWLIYYRDSQKALKEIQKIPLSTQNYDSNFSPIYYNKEKQFLIVKHYRSIYFLQRQRDGNFEQQSSLEYTSNIVFATVSNNGNYLVTWTDKEKNQIIKEDKIKNYHIYELEYEQV